MILVLSHFRFQNSFPSLSLLFCIAYQYAGIVSVLTWYMFVFGFWFIFVAVLGTPLLIVVGSFG